MREITTPAFAVFTLDELDTDARERAIETVSGKLTGDWWDSNDNDEIALAMVFALAGVLGTPGRDRFGEGDFPGIDGVALDAWDLDRADMISVSGWLTRLNAPRLPWIDAIDTVLLTGQRWGTGMDVRADDDVEIRESELDAASVAMRAALARALEVAKQAGRDQLTYVGSAEYAEEHIQSNGLEFHADGGLYS